jgi:hypothetical protein
MQLLVTFALMLVLSLGAVEASLVVAVAKAAAQSEERAAATTSLRSATSSALNAYPCDVPGSQMFKMYCSGELTVTKEQAETGCSGVGSVVCVKDWRETLCLVCPANGGECQPGTIACPNVVAGDVVKFKCAGC